MRRILKERIMPYENFGHMLQSKMYSWLDMRMYFILFVTWVLDVNLKYYTSKKIEEIVTYIII